MHPRVSIVIPNWNGLAFLARCLAGTLQTMRASGETAELIVMDDASTDGSAETVARDFPSARLIANPTNVGFGETVNRGVAAATGEFIVLLNNDIVPKEAMLGELLAPLLAEKDVFGTTGKALEWDGSSPNHLSMTAHWSKGNFHLDYADPPDTSPTMFLLGGMCAFRRQEFLRLGGLCALFAPGYWEDYDISYLALKAGWRNLYAPRALGHHFGQGSMTRALGGARLNAVKERNALLFTWLNITDRNMLREHVRHLPAIAWSAFADRDENARIKLKALLRAARLADAVAREKRRREPFLRRSDRDILAEFSAPATAAIRAA